jgi:leader peptidase (prepilin peptidase)/N-methyltransferase
MEILTYLTDWHRALAGAVLGAIMGSFIGALCSRWPGGQSIISGRSRCDGCNRDLGVWELIPVISFLSQDGRCRGCGTAIGGTQLFAEIAAMTIGGGAFLFLPPAEAINLSLLGWLLLPLIILDFEHLWLPDRLLAILGFTGLTAGILGKEQYDWPVQIVAAIAGWLALSGVRWVYQKLRNIEGMGSGDPKLFAALALWILPDNLPMLLLGASILGLAFALLPRPNSTAAQQQLPFGSFLGISAIVMIAVDPLLN